MPAPLDYTTKVPADQTVGEIARLLVAHGATAIRTDYADRQPVALAFAVETPFGLQSFSLPARVEGVQRAIGRAKETGQIRSHAGGLRSRDQALRVAWRQIKHWVEAQLALIEAEMASLPEVMLPYLQVTTPAGPQRLYEHFVAARRLELPPGDERRLLPPGAESPAM